MATNRAEDVLDALITGLAVGATYGLVAMGYSVAFYVTRVVNFAEGELLMVSVMVTSVLVTSGLPTWIALVVGVACAGALSVATYLVAVWPVLRVTRISFAWFVSTLGMAVILENLAAAIWGTSSRPYPVLLSGTRLALGSVNVTGQDVLAIGLAVVLAVSFELVRRKTLFGRLGIATAADAEMAEAIGGNTRALAIVAFAYAGLLAGVAGVLIGPVTFAGPYLGDTYGIGGFVAIMLAGMRKPAAAVAGGLLYGVLIQLANTYINGQAADWFPIVMVFIVLIARPYGLFDRGQAGSRRSVRPRLRRNVT